MKGAARQRGEPRRSAAALFLAAATLALVAGRCDCGPRLAREARLERDAALRPEGGDRPDSSPEGGRLDGRALPYECLVPDVPIEASEGCAEEDRYPTCRHRLPDPEAADGLYEIWRNTTPDHLWGRPALVRFVLATAREYERSYPGDRLTVGDLDAPGPRHKTHNRGVDVDLYLPGFMATENRGRRDYASNYDGRPEEEVREKRRRVLALAKMAAGCAGGRVRIYYNDPPILDAFTAWFERVGLDTPFRRPMEPHNLLHLFHFHVTVPRALPLLPSLPGAPSGEPAGAEGGAGDAGSAVTAVAEEAEAS